MHRGHTYRERDSNGWRIPREGTKTAAIYRMLQEGKRPKEIATALNHSFGAVRVLIHRIKHPDHVNDKQFLYSKTGSMKADVALKRTIDKVIGDLGIKP